MEKGGLLFLNQSKWKISFAEYRLIKVIFLQSFYFCSADVKNLKKTLAKVSQLLYIEIG